MANLFTVALLQLLWLEVLDHLTPELLEVTDQLGERFQYVSLEISIVYEDTEFL